MTVISVKMLWQNITIVKHFYRHNHVTAIHHAAFIRATPLSCLGAGSWANMQMKLMEMKLHLNLQICRTIAYLLIHTYMWLSSKEKDNICEFVTQQSLNLWRKYFWVWYYPVFGNSPLYDVIISVRVCRHPLQPAELSWKSPRATAANEGSHTTGSAAKSMQCPKFTQ